MRNNHNGSRKNCRIINLILLNAQKNIDKYKAAKEKLKKKFVIVTEEQITKLSNEEIKKLHDNDDLKFIDRYEQKFLQRYNK